MGLMGQVALAMLNALLVPRGAVAWIARLLLWCCFAFIFYATASAAFGMPIHLGLSFILVSLSVTPPFALTMFWAKTSADTVAQLTHVSQTDELTGLLNRRGFTQLVAQRQEGVLLIIDIDHFKHVNDRYGHNVGDEVLRAMGSHLRRNTRKSDTIGRLGGEEFAIFLEGVDSMFVDQIGERLCQGFVVYNDEVQVPIGVTMSAGAAFSAMAKSKSDVYLHADQALYQSKRSGRARLTFWQPPVSSRY
ncbi:MAG: GGDEF domain-containing protein [Pseudomonadota bacterium]